MPDDGRQVFGHEVRGHLGRPRGGRYRQREGAWDKQEWALAYRPNCWDH